MHNILSPITKYKPTLMEETPISYAVIVPLIEVHPHTYEILLLQRPYVFSSYAGDICFPGGLKEPDDPNLLTTACREMQEETGILVDHSYIIAQLDDFHDRRERLVRPFVAKFSQQILNTIQTSAEVHQVYYLPLEHVLKFTIDEKNAVRPSTRKPSYLYQNHELLIWGLTAAILVHLGNIVYHLHKTIGYQPEPQQFV